MRHQAQIHSLITQACSPKSLSASLLKRSLVLALICFAAAPLSAHAVYYSTSNFQENTDLKNTLLAIRYAHQDISDIAIAPSGDWVVVTDSGVTTSTGISWLVPAWIEYYQNQGLTIDAVAFDPDGDWIVVAEKGRNSWL